jgi:NADH:ubiquinone oxidoreductase subunit F (NADH-binding)
MTAMARRPVVPPLAMALGEPRLLRGIQSGSLVDAGHHRHLHGVLPTLDERQLIGLCSDVALLGRGGAGFPVAQKLAAMGTQANGRRRRNVVVNATESEPASHKDRLLVQRFPHLVLDGARLVADALGAGDVHVAIHGDSARPGLLTALADREDSTRFQIDCITGGFVSGEARALVRAIDGEASVPPGRRTLPTQRGVGGGSSFLSNAETFAQLAVLARLGPVAFRSVGTTEEPGTTLLSVGGAVARPGVLEVPLGTSLDSVLSAVGARPATAIVIGGYHGAWLVPRAGMRISRRAMSGVGATLGAGVLLVLDEETCALGELSRVASWLANESARQCGPCMFGLPALLADLDALAHGRPGSDRAVARHAGLVSGRGACSHPDGAVRFITSGLAALTHEVSLHRRRGGCGRRVLGQLPVIGSARG